MNMSECEQFPSQKRKESYLTVNIKMHIILMSYDYNICQ